MNTKLKLSHDELAILTAIADQDLCHSDIEDELFRQEIYPEGVEELDLDSMVVKGLITCRKNWLCFYAIAPEILALNQPPYSYESWRALSE